MISRLDYSVKTRPIWCAYCGDYGVLSCFLNALARLEIDPARLAIISGIGCAGRFPAFVKCYGFHGVHGRALPVATGLKVARPDLTVMAMGGDGDGLGIGGGHFLNAGRRNVDITYLLFDNSIYGMTKGQPSPTTPAGTLSRSTPSGNPDKPLNPAQLAIMAGYTFVGRGYSGKGEDLVDLLVASIEHRGTSFVQVLTPCVTHNHEQTYQFYQKHTALLDKTHDPGNWLKALEVAEMKEKICLGVLYQEMVPVRQERVAGGEGKAVQWDKLLEDFS